MNRKRESNGMYYIVTCSEIIQYLRQNNLFGYSNEKEKEEEQQQQQQHEQPSNDFKKH
jgi:hypothetical protein